MDRPYVKGLAYSTVHHYVSCMTRAWAALSAKSPLELYDAPLPKRLGENEVRLEVLSCGICHSDIHLIDNDWGVSSYPLVAGHEILGRVIERGSAVSHLSHGDIVGVGWQSKSCLTCEACITGRENLCTQAGATCVGHVGGFAEEHVTDSRFCFKMPRGLDVGAAAPLLCGGATVFSPLTEHAAKHGRSATRVGVVGLGGLGHLAIKFAEKLGYEVTAFSSSPSKYAELKQMGAHHVASSTDDRDIAKHATSLDLVLVTIPYDLNWIAYLRTLRPEGTLCFVGVPPKELSFSARELLNRKLNVTASLIGSRSGITEMLTFAARHGITATTETFAFNDVNAALARVRSGQIRYRAVLSRA